MSYSRFVTPDQRMRRIESQARREAKRQQDLNDQEVKRLQQLMQVEAQRQQLLERQESDRIGREFKVEQQRQNQFEERDSFRQEFSIEQQRQRMLDADKAPRGEPSPSPSGRFVDRIAEQPESVRQFQAQFPGEDVPGTTPQPTVGFERLTAEEQQASFEGGFPLNLEAPVRKAQHLWLRRAGQLTQEGLSVEEALSRAEAELGPAIQNVLTPEERGGIAGRFERGLPRVVEGIGKGISAVDEAAFQVNKFINEQLGTPPEQQPRREDISVLGGRLTEQQRETLGGIPIVGPAIEREAEFLSSPAGLAATLAWPTFVLRGAVGGVVLAGGARAAGAPEEVEIGAQVAGNVFAPGAGIVPNLGRLGSRTPQATAYATRITEEITTARSAAAALRKAGLTSKADELERFAEIAEGSLARAEGRALVSEATGDVIGEGVTATKADIAALQTIRAETIGDISVPEFAQAAVRADVPATGELISSQVLQPRPQAGPAILEGPPAASVEKALARGQAGGGPFRGGELGHADLPTAPNVVDAPQSGFHGTGAKFEAFSEGALDTTALYGPGVYITDDVSIATSYATRRARQVSGASPTVQTVTARPGLKLLNMERPLPDEAINVLERIAQADVSETADALFEGVRVAREGAPGKEVYSTIRNELRREELFLSAGDAGEVLESANLALKDAGFDGITHIGGIRGGKPHRVSVLFDPADATISSGTIPLGPRSIPSTLRVEGGQIVGGGEAGGGTFAGVADAKDFFGRLVDPLLPQGGIPGGFVPKPKGMKPGAKVTGLTQEGEHVEGTLIQVSGEKAIVRDTAGNVRPVTAPTLVEAAEGVGIGERLQDIVRDFRFGPSSRTAVPSLDPSVQRFVRVLRTAKPTQRTLKAERAAELGRRAAKGRTPFEAEARTPEEALKGLRAAQRGKLPEPPEFEVRLPSGEKGVAADAFTQEEVTNFINIARFSPTLDRELFTRGNIIESLIGSLDKKGILFGRLPTPGELKQLERVYGAEFARELQKLRPFGERFWRLTLDALNIPRSFLAAFDLSFPFRQGVFAIGRHPKEFFGNLPAMLRAAKNPEFAEQMVAAIKNDRTLIKTTEGFRPLNELMEEARLFLPDISGTEAFEARAEEFLSQLAHRIPGVGFSERGFIAYGDKLRSDIFRNTLQSWARQAKPATADEIADLGILLNVLTGRGNLPPELAKSLSFGFFAPRFAASRPQLFLAATINNLPGVRKATGIALGAPGQTTRVARLASQELVTSVGMGMTILALVKLSGVGDVELDPRSSDFGKIKIGKTRIDFWGGARPWATMIARMITGKSRSVTGEYSISRLSTLGRFGRSKLAPPAAVIVDVAAGETAIGEEIGTRGDILRRTLPLAIQDVADAVIQEGGTAGMLSTAAFLGVGFQTYETVGEKKKRAFEEAFPDRTYQATPDDNRLVRGAIEEGNNKAALEDAFQPSPEQMKTEEVRVAQATEMGLFTLAQGVEELRGKSAEEILTGNNDAGPQFAEAWPDYLDRVSGAIFEAVFGKEKRGSPEYLAWRDIKLQRDPDTLEPLWDEFFTAKDAAFAKLDPRLQRALDLVDAPGDDPVLQRAVEDFNASRKKRRELFDIPRWTGISATEQKRIENVHDLVERKRTELAFQGFTDVESGTIYQLVAKENGIADDLLRKAFSLRSGSNTASLQRNPEYDQTLLASTETLLPFFPDMFRRRDIQRSIGSGAETESFIPLNSLAADPLAAEPSTSGSFVPLEALAAR